MTRARFAAPLAAAALLTGCGYVGEPLPPLLRIPARATDLTVTQRGSRLVFRFTLPALTTEDTVLDRAVRVELRVGPTVAPFDAGRWAEGAKVFGELPDSKPGAVKYEISADEWMGREAVAAVKIIGENGRDAGWSNFTVIQVISPLTPPRNLSVESTVAGVRLTWQSGGPEVRVFRQSGEEQGFSPAATVRANEWLDAGTVFGQRYRYYVQSISGAAESEYSLQVAIAPVDRFPPAMPQGLSAVESTGSIELAWERSTEPDFATYRVYRDGERLSDGLAAPNYSDRAIQSGKRYRYAVSALDRDGNESPACPPVEVTAP